MAHLVIVRGWPPNTEVLLQARSRNVSQGDKFGLPGGSLDGVEKEASNDDRLPDDLRWRVRRRGALREACEELGHGHHHASSARPCTLPEVDLGNDQKLDETVTYSCIPERLAEDFVDDVRTSVAFQDNRTYFFLYHMDGDSKFFREQWQPRAIPEFRWEIDESIGTYGYIWHPLDQVLTLKLCSWVHSFFSDFDVVQALQSYVELDDTFNGEKPYPRKPKHGIVVDTNGPWGYQTKGKGAPVRAWNTTQYGSRASPYQARSSRNAWAT